MMTLILLILLIVLSVTLAILITSHRHDRRSSEAIRRLDERHQQTLEFVEEMKGHTAKIEREAQEIRAFFGNLEHPTHQQNEDIHEFTRTGRFTTS